jgi:hypothetical protein
MTRKVLILLLIAGGIGSAALRRNPHVREFRRKVATREPLARSAGSAAVNHLRNSPHEWGRGPLGFAKRVGSSIGQHAAKEGIQIGVGAIHHEDLRYHRSNLHGTLPRMGYAVKHTFIVPSTKRRGRHKVALGRISGNMGAGMISRVWMPASAAGIGAGVASGGIGLGADVGMNMAREFWPRKHHKRVLRARR